MKIGALGAGKVGATLGTHWARKGHSVLYGSRTPDSNKMEAVVAAARGGARAVSIADAAEQSDVLLLSIPWDSAREVLEACGDLSGKVVMDATNPILPALAGMAVGTTSSGAEQLAEFAPHAHFVKAFNTVGWNIMEKPVLQGTPALMCTAGTTRLRSTQ